MESRPPRIAASSYSNTSPLIWSFLYGSQHGKVELILDNAPARSAELLAEGRVDAALTPVIEYQRIEGARLVPDVCVGAKERVRSVCLVTRGQPLEDVRIAALDSSSRTSVVLVKILFREFLGFEPVWQDAAPDVQSMLKAADCAMLIGDPALRLTASTAETSFRTFDLAELWHEHTGLGFVFAMWMTRAQAAPIDLAAARDEGLRHIDEIAANYAGDIGLTRDDISEYLSSAISYSVDEKMQDGMKLFFELAFKNELIDHDRPLEFTDRTY